MNYAERLALFLVNCAILALANIGAIIALSNNWSPVLCVTIGGLLGWILPAMIARLLDPDFEIVRILANLNSNSLYQACRVESLSVKRIDRQTGKIIHHGLLWQDQMEEVQNIRGYTFLLLVGLISFFWLIETLRKVLPAF